MSVPRSRFNPLEGENIQRYVQTHKATLTFPEKLMYLMLEIERSYFGSDLSVIPIGWVNNGTVIVIRDEEKLVRHWLPRFFDRSIKLSSFLRKCYRWGFRRLSPTWEMSLTEVTTGNVIVYITCEWFQRNNQDLMYNMESLTSVKIRARKTRRQLSAANAQSRQETHELPETSAAKSQGKKVPRSAQKLKSSNQAFSHPASSSEVTSLMSLPVAHQRLTDLPPPSFMVANRDTPLQQLGVDVLDEFPQLLPQTFSTGRYEDMMARREALPFTTSAYNTNSCPSYVHTSNPCNSSHPWFPYNEERWPFLGLVQPFVIPALNEQVTSNSSQQSVADGANSGRDATTHTTMNCQQQQGERHEGRYSIPANLNSVVDSKMPSDDSGRPR